MTDDEKHRARLKKKNNARIQMYGSRQRLRVTVNSIRIVICKRTRKQKRKVGGRKRVKTRPLGRRKCDWIVVHKRRDKKVSAG